MDTGLVTPEGLVCSAGHPFGMLWVARQSSKSKNNITCEHSRWPGHRADGLGDHMILISEKQSLCPSTCGAWCWLCPNSDSSYSHKTGACGFCLNRDTVCLENMPTIASGLASLGLNRKSHHGNAMGGRIRPSSIQHSLEPRNKAEHLKLDQVLQWPFGPLAMSK